MYHLPISKENDEIRWKIRWKNDGNRVDVILLCTLLKENAIPTKTLSLKCKQQLANDIVNGEKILALLNSSFGWSRR